MSKSRREYLALRQKRLWRRVGSFACFGMVFVGVVFGSICISKLANNTGIQKTFAVMDGGGSALPTESLDEFSQNDILFYYPCDGINSGGQTAAGSCAKLAELRQAMWNEASEDDKESFMKTVCEEDCSIAGVEGYMNQIISHHGTNGELHDWLTGQCEKFRPAEATCTGSHKISDEEQGWINEALGGSNNIRFAIGNASGGSSVGAGKIVCVWDKKEKKCRDDVDYSKSGGNGSCSEYSSDSSGECWGLEDEDKWAASMESQCGGNNSLGSTQSGGTSGGASVGNGANAGPGASSSITWDKEGWITGGMDGYKKEPSGGNGSEDGYEHETPNKIVLHYTQGTGKGIGAYSDKEIAPHFTIDLLDKEVSQHFPLSEPSGALSGKKGGPSDTYDHIQIEIVGYGFQKNTNPDNPGPDSKCIIDGDDYTSNDRCFAKYGDAEWGYLAQLLKGINKWGKENGIDIPLTSSVTWTGDTGNVRLSKSDYDNTVGIVAHMHVPHNDHDDTGNIWPMVQAALGQVQCGLNGNEDSILGAKNAEKQASEVGKMSFGDNNAGEMKTLLENYGDLAYRTGQAYGVPWIAILVQGRYEDSKAECGNNNFWGIGCSNGSKKGEGTNLTNLGEGFKAYGKTLQKDRYKDAVAESDPYEYLVKLGKAGWRVDPVTNKPGYAKDWLSGVKKSIDALTKYIESDEGKQVIAQFGATSCDKEEKCSIEDGALVAGDDAILAAVQKIIDLANENGSEYSYGGGRSISHFKDVVDKGAKNNIDCTGFASMVYWMVYGDEFDSGDIFSSSSILNGMSSYREVSRSELRPGDIFAYSGHGGIVVEVKNGKVTKIAETGGKEGRSGKNHNIGYSSKGDYSIRRMNSSAGHFYRWKGKND